MRQLILMVLTISVTNLVAITNPPATKSVNVEQSTVTWKGQKVLGSHHGTINLQSGELEFSDSGQLIGGTLVMDMTSIAVGDLKGKGADNLAGHLKSDDFFGVASHPTSTFEISKVVSRGSEGSYKIIGNITIKNITKEIKFNATITDTSANAEIKLDRTDFDVRYGSGSFFDNLGDKTIYDEFDLTINLVF